MFNACWAKHVECTTLLYLGDFTVGLNAWFPPVLFRISVKPIDSSLVVLNAVGSPTKDLRVYCTVVSLNDHIYDLVCFLCPSTSGMQIQVLSSYCWEMLG